MFVQIKPEYGENYKRGQIYFTYEIGSPISRGISWFSYKGQDVPQIEKISHCGICVGPELGISAQPNGVAYENLGLIFSDPYRRIFFKEPKLLDKIGPDKLTDWALSKLGTKYDFPLAFGIAVVNSWIGKKLSERVRKEILRFFDAKDRMLCSETVAKGLFDNGYCRDFNTRKTPQEIILCGCLKEWKSDAKIVKPA